MESEVSLFDGRRSAADGKVVEGKDGWLFLHHDKASVVKQHCGELPLDETQLAAWHTTLERRHAQLEELGIPYFFLIAPDAHAVYPEKLPDDIRPAPERPVTQLLSYLRRRGSAVEPIYPLAELLAAKAGRQVYSATDSHWNAHGTMIAYEQLLDRIEPRVPVRRVHAGDLPLVESRKPGDLGFKLTPPRASEQVRFHPAGRGRRQVQTNDLPDLGRMLALVCDEAPDTRCVLFGDSSAAWLVTPLAETFRRLVVAYHTVVDLALVRQERADVVVSVLTERRLESVPDDPPADEPVLRWARAASAEQAG